MMQSEAIRLINKIGYRDHIANPFKAMIILKLRNL